MQSEGCGSRSWLLRILDAQPSLRKRCDLYPLARGAEADHTYLKVIAINSDIYLKLVTTEVSDEEKDSKDDPAQRYAIGREEKQVKQPQKVGVPQRRNHGEVIWSSGDTGASVPERKTKNCLFEDTKARRGVYQVGGEGGGVTGYVWEVSPAHRPMPMTLATLSTLAGPSSMVPGAPTMPGSTSLTGTLQPPGPLRHLVLHPT